MKNIDKKIEETLNSLDGMNRAEPRPFFYTRLKARMENEASVSTYAVRKLKPALLVPMLACSLLLSVASVYTVLSYDTQDASLSSRDAFIQEYGLNESVSTLNY
ncbi:MAG: hypothetical protein NWQ46_11145 [Spirosomaceae bacterium]|nr:hypothetical protein [Spirosomataceae bacterium]MDP5140488.1 hypothetical protein [Spirosomataceae bacterium]